MLAVKGWFEMKYGRVQIKNEANKKAKRTAIDKIKKKIISQELILCR